MNIKLISRTPFNELEQKVRSVPLLKARNPDGSPIYVYQNAEISLRTVSPSELNPTTFYLLKNNLQFQRKLHAYLLQQYDIDSLALEEAIELENTDTGERWTLMPPVIEISEEDICFQATRGDLEYPTSYRVKMPIINDGAHRVYVALEQGKSINVVFINNIPSEHPFYAYPNRWEEVKIVDQVPKTMAEKKLYRRQESYDLYRDFGVLGCGAPRKVGK